MGLRFVEASGTNFEIGRQIGEQTREEIQAVVKRFDALHADMSTESELLFNRFLKIADVHYPHYVRELEGMALGAQVPFEKILKLNIRETQYTKKGQRLEEGCSTLILKEEARVLIAHNEDMPVADDAYVQKITLENGTSILALNYYGSLIGLATTINSNDIFFSCNLLTGNTLKTGIPKRFISRKAAEAEDWESFKKTVLHPQRAEARNYVFTQKGNVFDIESSHDKHVIQEVHKRYVHGNVFQENELLIHEGKSRGHSAFSRIAFLQKNKDVYASQEDMKRLLSSHENRPRSVCRHGGDDKANFKTGAHVQYDSRKPRNLRIGEGNTCQAVLETSTL